ncbi:MAG TPA: coproporphyrinogen III oxidase [Pseudoclavibacter sp.]|nr:coproporphyrinogen III oxidase [Pseudoclavibacter sp.]
MASALPDGDPAPADGLLPGSAAAGALTRDFGVYIHVPFCRVRCGYCDFNTYTATQLGGVRQQDYADQAIREMEFASRVLGRSGVPARPVATVFFGGGTPTLLAPGDLSRMLAAVRDQWGLSAGAEVTVEANPDSVDARYLQQLAADGVTRVSFGMQSAVPEVLRVLDRTHDPDRMPFVVQAARQAGLDVSVDLIYGAPGETMAQWQRSVTAALELNPDHISAYALIVETGTKLARQIRRGEVPAPDEELEADKYWWADAQFSAAGLHWYELSNWARPGHHSRHNLAYWTGQDWWGVGPGAHSHIGGVRWWNVKHPAAYAGRIGQGVSPAAGREVVDEVARAEEKVLLETRLARGIRRSDVYASAEQIAQLVAEGLINSVGAPDPRLVLTRRGRMLADAIVQRLLLGLPR